MPCYDSRDSPSYVREEARAEFRHNSDVAEMLCSVLSQLAAGNGVTISAEMQLWWSEHQQRDNLRGKK